MYVQIRSEATPPPTLLNSKDVNEHAASLPNTWRMHSTLSYLLLALLVSIGVTRTYGLVFPLEHTSLTGPHEVVLTTFHFLSHGTFDVEIDQAPTRSTRVLSVYPISTYRSVHFAKPAMDLCSHVSAVRVEIGPYPSAAGDGYRRSFDIYEKGLYVVVMQDCSLPQEGDGASRLNDDDVVEGKVVMRNTADSAFPLAEHFSFERHGFLAVYSALFGLVTFGLCLWFKAMAEATGSGNHLAYLITLLFLVKYIEVLLRFAYVLSFTLDGREKVVLMRVARNMFRVSEIFFLVVLVVIASVMKLRTPTSSLLRTLLFICLFCGLFGVLVSECRDYIAPDESSVYVLSVTPHQLPYELIRNTTTVPSDLAFAVIVPVCQVYIMVEFVVTSMTKLVIFIVLHLSIVKLKADISGSVWDKRKAKLFSELVRLLNFRLHYLLYVVLPIAVGIIKRLALELDSLEWVEEGLYQFGTVYLLLLLGIMFKPDNKYNDAETAVLIRAIKGDAGLDEGRQESAAEDSHSGRAHSPERSSLGSRFRLALRGRHHAHSRIEQAETSPIRVNEVELQTVRT